MVFFRDKWCYFHHHRKICDEPFHGISIRGCGYCERLCGTFRNSLFFLIEAVVNEFVFAGVGCSFLGYHDYHDIIGELHSATVFPLFILLQSALSICSGIINFMEKPSNEIGFWISFSMLMIAPVLFVEVMEYNEPQ